MLIVIIILFILCIRIFLIEKEINNISKQLNEFTEGKTRKKIHINLSVKSIEKLSFAINKNIINQEQAQIDIKNHEERLKESIANISHDLRTPLTSILGYITLLKNKPNIEYLEIIEHRAKTLNYLINDFYELSILDDNNFNIEFEKLDIVSIVTECLMGSYSLFEDRNIMPIIKLPQEAVFVIGNTIAYQRIFQNLISNAVKYSLGEVEINLSIKEKGFVFTITNNNNLITQEDIFHIFDRFYIKDKSRSKGSTGLGLYIVKTLIEKMNGTIEAKLNNNLFTIIIEYTY